MIAELAFNHISVQGLRSLRRVQLTFSAKLNVVLGGNGQGKTSLLEAICLVATSRSFRTAHTSDVVQQGAQLASISAELHENDISRRQRVVLGPNERQYYVDGERVARLAAYATRTPIVVFHPGDLELVTGPAARRRALLDRIALYLDPTSHDDRLAFLSAHRQRQTLLSSRTDDTRSLDAFEAIVAQRGLRYAQSHRAAAQRLCPGAQQIFETLSSGNLTLQTELRSVADLSIEQYQRELHDRRGLDSRTGRASFGPHRDELCLSFAGKSARRRGSQGQQRLLALALKLAELQCVRDARRTHPVLLLDDVSSELDLSRANSVINWLTAIDSQIFLTTPRIDLISSLLLCQNDRQLFTAQDGEVRTECHT